MTQLVPIRLDEDTIIYIEATEDIKTDIKTPETDLKIANEDEEEEEAIVSKSQRKARNVDAVRQQMMQNFKAIEGTIRAYTIYTLAAFKKVAIADIRKVTLEFGLEIGGEAGVPYITKGTAKSNLKITVECGFSDTAKS